MRLLPLLLLGPALLVVAACGGGGGGDQNQPPTDQLVIHPVEFGISSDGSFFGQEFPEVGDSALNAIRKGFLRFPVPNLPPGAQIVSVEVQARETSLGNPFTVFAGFRTEVIPGGANLDATDIDVQKVNGSFAVDFSTPVAQNAIRTIDVTAMMDAVIAAGFPNFDFRVSPLGSSNNDNAGDLIIWAVDQQAFPVLVVTFVP